MKLTPHMEPLMLLQVFKSQINPLSENTECLKSWGREELLWCDPAPWWNQLPSTGTRPPGWAAGQGPGGSCASVPVVGHAAPLVSTSGLVSPARASCVGSNSSPKCSSRLQWKTQPWAIKYGAPEPQILPQWEVPDYLYAPM